MAFAMTSLKIGQKRESILIVPWSGWRNVSG
jgi:hypothetical protein